MNTSRLVYIPIKLFVYLAIGYSGSLSRYTMLCKAYAWACLQDTAKSGLQVATTEGAFKLQGPITRGATQVCF